MAVNEGTNVTTGIVRMSYVHLFKPYAHSQDQDPKFSVTILIPKSDTVTMGNITRGIEAAKQRGANDKWNGVIPPGVTDPVADGDGMRQDGTPFGPECRGHYIITARSSADRPPEVVDTQLQPIINQAEIYSGIYGRVNVDFFPYFNSGKKGIGCALNSVQKLRDGEALGGSAPTAAEAFGTPVAAPPTYSNYRPQMTTYRATTGAVDPITGMPIENGQY